MATISFTSPTLTITFTPTELAVLSRVLTEDAGAFKNLITSWLQQKVQQYQQKDIVNINIILNQATPQQIAQICQALGIAQS